MRRRFASLWSSALRRLGEDGRIGDCMAHARFQMNWHPLAKVDVIVLCNGGKPGHHVPFSALRLSRSTTATSFL